MATVRTPQELVAVWRSLAQHWQAARSESRAERGRFRVRAEVYADLAAQLVEVLAGEAESRALLKRKAAALDKLEDRKESIMHSLSARSIGDEPHSHWHLCDAALEDDKHSLLALADALPDAPLAQAQAAHEAGIKEEMAAGGDPAAEGCDPHLSQPLWDAITGEEE